MAEDDTSDPARRRSDEEEGDSSDRERQERLVFAFAELEGLFEIIEADDCDVPGSVVRALATEVETARKRLTFEPDTVAEAELRELVQRIGDELAIDFEPSDAGSD